MPSRTVWNLTYQVRTEDELAIFRHHYEVLSNDPHVVLVDASQDVVRPNVRHMRVEFGSEWSNPEAMELQHLNLRYDGSHVEFSPDLSDVAGAALDGQVPSLIDPDRVWRPNYAAGTGLLPTAWVDQRDQGGELSLLGMHQTWPSANASTESVVWRNVDEGTTHAVVDGIACDVPAWVKLGRKYKRKEDAHLNSSLMHETVVLDKIFLEERTPKLKTTGHREWQCRLYAFDFVKSVYRVDSKAALRLKVRDVTNIPLVEFLRDYEPYVHRMTSWEKILNPDDDL
jgi:hypothetical protein